MNHKTGPAPAFSKICAIFGFLLIALAFLAIPGCAADVQIAPASEEPTHDIAANLTADQTAGPAGNTSVVPSAESADNDKVAGDPARDTVADPAVEPVASPAEDVAADHQAKTPDTREDARDIEKSQTGTAVSSGNAENSGELTVSAAAPVVAFHSSQTTGLVPLTVDFSDDSTGTPTGWAWYFGDETYNGAWTQQPSPPWGNRGDNLAVALPDGSIVVMEDAMHGKVWRSTDQGKSWAVQTDDNRLWAVPSAVALPKGGIVVMVKYYNNSLQSYYNSAWLSTDQGKTWTWRTNTPGWDARTGTSVVALPDDSFLVMGGRINDGFGGKLNYNDVWRSADQGKTWTRQTAAAGWSARMGASSVVLSDGSIVLMGGHLDPSDNYYNDTWISSDTGKTWTRQTASAGWSPRYGASAVALPDDTILLMGGSDDKQLSNDIWRSSDKGKTWARVTERAAWAIRWGHQSMMMPDGSIILTGGHNNGEGLGVWHLDTAGSSQQNPTHAYMKPGSYQVALQAYNAGGYNSTRKAGYINTFGSNSNIITFGNTFLQPVPFQGDYRSVGGSSAIRRDGALETDPVVPPLTGDNWVQVTNGAAITANGDLALWNVSHSQITPPVVRTIRKATPDKKYVSVSQFASFENYWLLAIYEDAAGLTHLELIPNPSLPPAAVAASLPTGTGWKMISAGNNHALALRSDGTLVAWGDNTYGQLNLPADQVYSDIAAGSDFSLGLTTISANSAGGRIYARGKDNSYVVSKAPSDPEPYIQIEAGSASGAALTKDGFIRMWGAPVGEVSPPPDRGYTGISIAGDLGFALREPAPELHIIDPLSPDTYVKTRDGGSVYIPKGALFDHNENGVMRVFDANGKMLFWVNDDEAAQVTFPEGTRFPSSAIHYLPKQSLILVPENYEATVYGTDTIISDFLRLAEQPPLMTTTAASWRDEQNASSQQLTPQGVCFADTGCSVGATSRGQLFLSKPQVASDGGIPVFSVQKFSDTMYVGKLSMLGSTNPANDRFIHIEKDRIDPDQPVRFNIMKSLSNSASDSGVVVTAKANLTSENAVLQYSGVATASQQLSTISMTPRIWRVESIGDVLVYTGDPKTCSGTSITTCSLSGNFNPVWDISNVTGTFFANVTAIYTLPAPISINGVSTNQVAGIGRSSWRNEVPVPEVLVTGPLNPLEPGKNADPANVNNTVPWGGMIEHVMDGDVPMTVVKNASGQPIHRANDPEAIGLGTPHGDIYPGTWIHQVPDGSDVDIGDNRSVVTSSGSLSYTENYSQKVYLNAIKIKNSAIQSNAYDPFSGYLEIAKATQTNNDNNVLNHLSGYWKIPTSPTYEGLDKSVFLFNAVQGPNSSKTGSVIVQPVLEYNLKDTGRYWTASSWVCGMPCVHTTRITGLSSGDKIHGQMHYLEKDSEHTTPFWQVTISKGDGISDPRRVNTTTQINNKSLLIMVGALEAYNITELSSLPGNTQFYDTTYLDQDYKAVSVSVTGEVKSNVPQWISKHLRVDVANTTMSTLRTDL